MGIAANRIYRRSELGLWLERAAAGWEKFFTPEEILYGRKLYKEGAVRTLELNASDAIVCAKLADGSEPYCVIDFDGIEMRGRGGSRADLTAAALRVAGLYEIEELVADAFSLELFPDAVLEQAAEKKDAQKTQAEGDSSPETSSPAEPESENEFPKLELHFSSRKKGLVFAPFWVFADGSSRRAFGEKCVPVSELEAVQRESAVRLAAMARKAGFKYEAGVYTLAEISKIPSFLQVQLGSWKKYFLIKKDKNVDLLALGEREVSLSPVAKTLGGNTADFDVEWSPSVGGKAVAASEFSKIVGAGITSLRIVPDYGILRLSSADTAFVKNVERAREYGFEAGKIPRYMLLSLSDFSPKVGMSGELKEWADSLAENTAENARPLPDFLRRYQKRGVLWADRLFAHDCNALIADEMGLGKTLQTLALVDMYLRETPSGKFFVACPASVIPVWISEAAKFFPNIRCGVFSGSSNFEAADLWISSYTQLRRNRVLAESAFFEMAALDEAQFIKNPDAKTTAACMALRARRKIALTGTPVENRPLDMWTAFRWLMPGLMGQRAAFEKSAQTDPSFLKNIRRQIAPFVLRRLKSEVAGELPEKIFVDLACPMSEQQKSEYQKLLSEARGALGGAREDDSKARFTVLSLLTRLRQAACDAALLPWVGKDGVSEFGGKISVLLDKLEELFLGGKKILVFSQFARFLELIEAGIASRIPDVPVFTLTGSTRDRAKPVEAFQEISGSAVMLVSLRAGGTGITLTSADYVFLADPWWNPAAEEQAIDRVHRIGRKGDVFVYRMIAQDTVEERVRKLQEKKRALFNDLLGGLKDVSKHSKFIETVADILS